MVPMNFPTVQHIVQREASYRMKSLTMADSKPVTLEAVNHVTTEALKHVFWLIVVVYSVTVSRVYVWIQDPTW